jgi:fatty acid desaturase
MENGVNGLGPLWIFFVASMAIVGAVVLAGAVDSWWILVPVMAIFFGSVAGVLMSIVHQLHNDG